MDSNGHNRSGQNKEKVIEALRLTYFDHVIKLQDAKDRFHPAEFYVFLNRRRSVRRSALGRPIVNRRLLDERKRVEDSERQPGIQYSHSLDLYRSCLCRPRVSPGQSPSVCRTSCPCPSLSVKLTLVDCTVSELVRTHVSRPCPCVIDAYDHLIPHS